jgi:hypothetical protein
LRELLATGSLPDEPELDEAADAAFPFARGHRHRPRLTVLQTPDRVDDIADYRLFGGGHLEPPRGNLTRPITQFAFFIFHSAPILPRGVGQIEGHTQNNFRKLFTSQPQESCFCHPNPNVAEQRANRVRVDADFSETPFKAKISPVM